jgi:hypothetical protein
MKPSFFSFTRALAAGSLILAAGVTTTSYAQPAPGTARPAAITSQTGEGAFDDDPRPVTAAEQIVNSAGLDAARLAEAQRQLLAILQKPDAPANERQAAAQQLGIVLLTGDPAGHAATLEALGSMLAEPARSDYARLALDRTPGASIDTLYLQALRSSSGRIQLGLIDALGTRGVVAAVPALAGLLNDPATARAAASALGRIGGSDALDALANAKDPLAPAVLDARLAAAATIDAATAAKASTEIYREPAAPLAQRSAALRVLIAANPAGAVEDIHAALIGSQPAFHQVAIESVASVPIADIGTVLAGRLPSYSPAVQAALVASIAQRNEAGAVNGLLALASRSTEEVVRLAAIEALGRMPGGTDTAETLVRVAATGEGDEAKVALASLARLNGPAIDDVVRTGAAADGDSARRAVFIQLLAARNQTEAIPFLFSLRQSPSDALRLKALDALRLIARPADQPALIEWALGTEDRTESARAVRALITLILRDGATATRTAQVIAALESGDSAARLTLLPVLSRVGGAPAVATAATLARAADEDVALAAATELTQWRDVSALPALVELVSSTPRAAVRDAAVQGAARFLAVRKNATAAQRSLYARQLLALPLDAVDRRAMINALSLCADEDALATARQFLAEPATAAAAQDAVDAITSNLAGPPALTASEAGERTALLTDGQRDTYWSIPNAAGGWLRLDLHNTRPVRTITLDQGLRPRDGPARLAVQVSDHPAKPGEPLFEVEGEPDQTIVVLPAGTRGRYVWLRQTGTRPDSQWAIAELIVE